MRYCVGGPRVCIGGSLAMLETRLVLATVAQRYELDLVEGFEAEMHSSVTLHPTRGLPMKARSIRR